jgi:hypothetical protein
MWATRGILLSAVINSISIIIVAMAESFKYQVNGTHPDVTVRISQQFWLRLGKALLWSLVWGIIAYSCVRSFGFRLLPIIGSAISLLLALIGLVVANFSAVWSTMWLRPDELKWLEIRPFRWHIRSFPLLIIRDFGFAIYSHGGPALRLDVDGTWYLLAEGILEREADKLLLDIRQRGIEFPLSSSERQKASDASIPRFWMLH